MAFRAEPTWRLLEGRHEARLPGRRFLDAVEVNAGRPRQGRLALRAVRRVEDRGCEEKPCRPDTHPGKLDSAQELHGPGTEPWWPDRVLPFAGSCPVVAD